MATGSSALPEVITPDMVTCVWVCPDFDAARKAASSSGQPEPEMTIHLEAAPATRDHCGREIQIRDERGRVVMRQWNRR
uniref:Uncharacterized protein n=1 Tax=Mesorhizobium phage vB_MseS-P1 TaxID=3120101 RepID=A0AB38ZLQ8_9VIRU